MKSIKFFITALLIMVSATAFAQNITVRGTVTDANGETIPGVAVLVKGTTTGVATDIDGKYTVSAPADGTLSFSSVGYKGADVAINRRSTVNVTLEADNTFLDEAVVTAQGLTRSQKAIGYSTVQIKGEDLTLSRQTDLGQTLAGKVSGARFFSSAGSTFSAGSIVLRGTTSYSGVAGSEPIYVVDGTITNKNAVNMDDVESVNILKGPAATALYGSQGGNGAVIITTKAAKNGEAHIEFSHTTQLERYYNHAKLQKEYGGGSYGLYGEYFDSYRERYGWQNVDMMSPAFLFGEYGEMANSDGSYWYDYGSDESWGPRYDPKTLVATANYWDPTSVDYMKAKPWVHGLDLADLFRTGVNNTTNVAVAKGGAGYNIRISFTNSDRTGIIENSRAIRRYLTAKATVQATPWLKTTLDYKFTARETLNGSGEGYGSATNPIDDYLQWGQTNVNLKEYKDYLRPDGTWRTWNPVGPDDLTANFHDNPYGLNYVRTDTGKYIWNVITADAEASLPFNIKLGAKIMGNLRHYVGETKVAPGSTEYSVTSYSQSRNATTDMTYQGRLTWSGYAVNDRLGIDVAAFIEEEDYDYGTLSGNTNGGLSIDYFYNLNASVNAVGASNSWQHYKTRSVYGNATLSFDDTYFLDASIRNDWDSKLPTANNHFLYGGASASIMLSQFVNAPWLDFWKLRASAAQVGSTLSAYSTTYTYGAGTKYNSVGTLTQSSTQLNQAIKPTISTSFEIGTEFKMFKNRIHGDINFYNRDTKNQIMNLDTPAQTGYSSRQINAGIIRNRGIEIALGGTLYQTRDFSWDADFNISKNVNTLVELTDGQTEYMLSWNKFYYPWDLDSVVGQPVGTMSTEARMKRDEKTGLPLLAKSTSAYWGGGYALQYETGVKKEVGNYQPDWIGGFSTDFRYKGFTLGLNFDYSIGGKIISWTNMWGYGSGILAESSYLNDKGVNVREPLSVGGGIRVDGIDESTGEKVTTYMNAYRYMHYEAQYDNDAWVYDRSYLKLREISFGYTIPRSILNKANLGISSASISLIASNPWLIYSAVPNIDVSEAGSNWLEGGQAASTRTFGATLRLVF